jgi:FkbM family methyltransferase
LAVVAGGGCNSMVSAAKAATGSFMLRPDLIYDVGMCDGGDTAFYLAKGFDVIAVEANPALVERNRMRFSRELEEGRLIIVNKAIGPTVGRTDFDIHTSNEHWSSIVADRRIRMAGQYKTIKVECTTLDTVIEQYGVPYYLKIDIEEADLDAVRSLDGLSERPKYLSAEAHSPEIVECLHRQGYQFFKLVDQGARSRMFTWPWKWREGRFVLQRFTGSHSGPFGEETPGDWLSRDEILAKYFDLRSRGKLTWHDVHAKQFR